MKKILSIVGVLLAVAVIGFYFYNQSQNQGQESEVAIPVTEEELSALYMEIKNTIRTEATKESSCKAIGIGARACGGVDGHMVYSTETTNVKTLEQLANAYLQGTANYIVNNRLISICSIEVAPEVALENGHCVERSK